MKDTKRLTATLEKFFITRFIAREVATVLPLCDDALQVVVPLAPLNTMSHGTLLRPQRTWTRSPPL
jgi:hypothetical protein